VNLTAVHVVLAFLLSAAAHGVAAYYYSLSGEEPQQSSRVTIEFIEAETLSAESAAPESSLDQGEKVTEKSQAPSSEDSEALSASFSQPDNSIPVPAKALVGAPESAAATESPEKSNYGTIIGRENSEDLQEAIQRRKLAQATYEQHVVAHLDRYKEYPKKAERRSLEADVVVSLELARDGSVIRYAIEETSEWSFFDEEVLQMIERAVPFPEAPPVLAGSSFRFLIPVNFTLPD